LGRISCELTLNALSCRSRLPQVRSKQSTRINRLHRPKKIPTHPLTQKLTEFGLIDSAINDQHTATAVGVIGSSGVGRAQLGEANNGKKEVMQTPAQSKYRPMAHMASIGDTVLELLTKGYAADETVTPS
jgi:hypothetical protein